MKGFRQYLQSLLKSEDEEKVKLVTVILELEDAIQDSLDWMPNEGENLTVKEFLADKLKECYNILEIDNE